MPAKFVQGADAKFSKAKFSWAANGNDIERYITAGCGNFTVVWSFRQVHTAAAVMRMLRCPSSHAARPQP